MIEFNRDIEKLMVEVESIVIKKASDYLEINAKLLLEKALSLRGFNNQTYNLLDSYGWGLWYNGKNISSGNVGVAKATRGNKYKGTMYYGRKEINRYIDTYKPTTSSGFELIWVVSMPYAESLENGTNTSRRKILVISQIGALIESVFGITPKTI